MTPKNILVPIDFSVGSEHALDYACSLGEKLGSTIHLVYSIGAALPELSFALNDAVIETVRSESMAKLDKLAKDRAPIAKFGRCFVEPGDARDTILKVAKSLEPDLLVMGSHGRRGVSRFVLGSVAEHVLRRANCPVLIVRTPNTNASDR